MPSPNGEISSPTEAPTSISNPNIKVFSLYSTPGRNYNVSTTKYITNVDSRGYLVVYEYLIRAPGVAEEEKSIMMDYQTRLVHFTSILKALSMKKVDVVKLVEDCPDIKPVKIRGGSLKIQGTWLEWEVAKELSARIAWTIKDNLIPIFGPDFPAICLPESHPAFGKLTLNRIEDLTVTTSIPPPAKRPKLKKETVKAINITPLKPSKSRKNTSSTSTPFSTINSFEIQVEAPTYYNYGNEPIFTNSDYDSTFYEFPPFSANSSTSTSAFNSPPPSSYSPELISPRFGSYTTTFTGSRANYYQTLQQSQSQPEHPYSFERNEGDSFMNYSIPSPTYSFGRNRVNSFGSGSYGSLPGIESFDPHSIQRRNSINDPIFNDPVSPPRKLLILPEISDDITSGPTLENDTEEIDTRAFGNFSGKIKIKRDSLDEKFFDGNRTNGMRFGERI